MVTKMSDYGKLESTSEDVSGELEEIKEVPNGTQPEMEVQDVDVGYNSDVEDLQEEAQDPVEEQPSSSDSSPNNDHKPFTYKDWDSLQNELCELYGYYELNFLHYNKESYIRIVENRVTTQWSKLHYMERVNIINDLLDLLEAVDETKQLNAILALNYLLQGCWGEFPSLWEQLQWIDWNAMLILKCDGFRRVWAHFSALSENAISNKWYLELDVYGRILSNSLNIMCTLIFVAISQERTKDVPRDDQTVFQALVDELNEEDTTKESLISILFGIMKQIIEHSPKCFLLKKLLLLIRSILLLTIGGIEDLRNIKESCREMVGLGPSKDDTILHCQTHIEPLQAGSMWNSVKARETLLTWSEFTELSTAEERCAEFNYKKPLPWTPKSSLESLSTSFGSKNDFSEDCMKISCGKSQILSLPVQQRVDLLLKYLYIPLSSFQIEQQSLISRFPARFTNEEKPFVKNIEKLFATLLPRLGSFSRCLLRILGEATPKIRMADVFVPSFSDEASSGSALEDSIRQAEIAAKAVAAILILLLKCTKINHIFQFECITAQILTASFLPIVLRYFNRDVFKFLARRPKPPDWCDNDFKVVTVEFTNPKDANADEEHSSEQLSHRNLTTYITLLRVINKVVKWKPRRILMLRMFKAPDCLVRCLKVPDPLFQQYVLKLLKMQCKYLGKDWKRNNRHTISAIFYKVRHRFLDDWVGGKTEAKTWPWECNDEETNLYDDILAYLARNYKGNLYKTLNQPDQVEFNTPESFKTNYESWLQKEVYDKDINWDGLIKGPRVI